MINLWDIGIHNDIEQTACLDQTFSFRFVKRLCDEFGVSKDKAAWAVSVWCTCYGNSVLGKDDECGVAFQKTMSETDDVMRRLKSYANAVFSLGDNMDGFLKSKGMDTTGRDLMRHEMARYCLYLCASDGKVSDEEARFMAYLFDYELNPHGLTQLIKNCKIYSTEFESDLPLSFVLVAEMDKHVPEPQGYELLLEAYKTIGKALLSLDGTTQNEINDFIIYPKSIPS